MSLFSNLNVVTLTNANILTSKNDELCLQSIFGKFLNNFYKRLPDFVLDVKPTQEIINAFNTQFSDKEMGQIDDNLETSTELNCSSFNSDVKNENNRTKVKKFHINVN